MSEEEIKAALSIEVEECSDMGSTWTEEVITSATINHTSNFDD